MKLILAAFLSLPLVFQSGCTSVIAGDVYRDQQDIPPSVSIKILSMDLTKEHLVLHETMDGPRNFPDTGLLYVETTVAPPGLVFVYEQSPDLTNWVGVQPASSLLIEAGPLRQIYRATFSPIISLDGSTFTRQYLRASF